MKLTTFDIPGLVLIEPKPFADERGFFLETYHARRYAEAGIIRPFVQDNHSHSNRRGVLRGIHSQLKQPQGKLIYVLRGEIWDVAVDIRRGSPTFGQWIGVTLSAENHHQLYVPEGCLHGYVVISDGAEWCVPGILEQLDPPGVHSGDSVAVLPPQRISRWVQEAAAEAAGRIALRLGLRGILNVQMIVAGERIVVIEANPRASRTVPIVAKATGRDVVAAAVRCALGATLAEVGWLPGLAIDAPLVAVKMPIGSLWRLPGVETQLGPEMRSTGEVLGLAPDYAGAMAAAEAAAAAHAVR